jgi:hypothetical protein
MDQSEMYQFETNHKQSRSCASERGKKARSEQSNKKHLKFFELGDLLQVPDGHLTHGRKDTLKPKWHKIKTGTQSLISTD